MHITLLKVIQIGLFYNFERPSDPSNIPPCHKLCGVYHIVRNERNFSTTLNFLD